MCGATSFAATASPRSFLQNTNSKPVCVLYTSYLWIAVSIGFNGIGKLRMKYSWTSGKYTYLLCLYICIQYSACVHEAWHGQIHIMFYLYLHIVQNVIKSGLQKREKGKKKRRERSNRPPMHKYVISLMNPIYKTSFRFPISYLNKIHSKHLFQSIFCFNFRQYWMSLMCKIW